MATSRAKRQRQRENRKLKHFGLALDRRASLESLAIRYMDDKNRAQATRVGRSSKQGKLSPEQVKHGFNDMVEYHNDGFRLLRIPQNSGFALGLNNVGFSWVSISRCWLTHENIVSDSQLESIVDAILALEGTYDEY